DDEMFRTLVATPLVVIDGRRGPLKTGDLPIYALPALILDLLGDERDTMLRFAARTDDVQRVRPLPGVHFTVEGGVLTVCRGGEPRCGHGARARSLQRCAARARCRRAPARTADGRGGGRGRDHRGGGGLRRRRPAGCLTRFATDRACFRPRAGGILSGSGARAG